MTYYLHRSRPFRLRPQCSYHLAGLDRIPVVSYVGADIDDA